MAATDAVSGGVDDYGRTPAYGITSGPKQLAKVLGSTSEQPGPPSWSDADKAAGTRSGDA